MTNELKDELEAVRMLMEECLAESPLGYKGMAKQYMRAIGSGKMLRAKMILSLGAFTGADRDRLRVASAAVEMIHAASLLHDDVIDGGSLRRGVPAFWVEHGVQGAILVGDMLLFKAIQLVEKAGDGALTGNLIELTGSVCMAEVEQELVLRGRKPEWDVCLSLARRKTGSLFAFSAYAAATDEKMAEALMEAGYLIGTAYQLCDDILDASGNVDHAQKSLGSDSLRKKTTAATVTEDQSSQAFEHISKLCVQAEEELEAWPVLQKRWQDFMEDTLSPVLEGYIKSNSDS